LALLGRNGPEVDVLYNETQHYFVVGPSTKLCLDPDIVDYENRDI